jgi:hypothetical protein
MLLAGQCPDAWVIAGPPQHPEAAPDWALLWEDTIGQYRDAFYPAQPNGNGLPIPTWWKDPAHRPKVAHTVHHCTSDQDWQDAIGLANERNAGLIYPLDVPGGTAADKYDHVADWFATACGWANSYNTRSVGLADHELLRAAHLWATRQGKVHGWPNFEQRWQGGLQVRGTYVLENPAGVARTVLSSQELGRRPPPLFDVSNLWRVVHEWATRQTGLLTAMPTFEVMPAGQVAVITFEIAKVQSWASIGYVPVGNTYQQPTFAEAGAVIRNVSRAAHAATPAHTTAFPTFIHDSASLTGREVGGVDQYECVFIDFPAKNPGSVGAWSDVDAKTYERALVAQ